MKLNADSVTIFRGTKYVFLDRDGVINRKAREGKYISGWKEIEILPRVEASIASLNRHGLHVIVVSNQRGIALGLYTANDVDALHARLQEHLSVHGAHIDGFYFCPHDNGECNCRKPGIGLFEQAFKDFPEANADNSVMIGDSVSDIEAGRNIGCSTIFVQGAPDTQKPGSDRAASLADAVVESLCDALQYLLTK
jgi:D-glycero-D-manno-heptose 1,7-bisphosphate phosphatase